jgi:hypothetical protein
MAKVDVSVSSDLGPEQAWKLASDLDRIDDWLTIFTDNHPGSAFRLVADLSGLLLSGPVGRLVARVLQSDVRKSVDNLATLS